MAVSDFEQALLTGTLQPASVEDANGAGPSRPSSSVRELGRLLLEAKFGEVLRSEAATAVFEHDLTLFDGLLVDERVGANGSAGDDIETSRQSSREEDEIRLVIAIALLHAFVKANWTGPDLDFSPADMVPRHLRSNTNTTELDSRAIPLLTLHGEPAYHLARHPALLVLARRIFHFLADGPSASSLDTLPVWLLRLHLVHLSLLDEPVPFPEPLLHGVRKTVDSLAESQRDLRAALHIELGKYHHALGNDKLANQEFLAAAQASGLQYELTGALGKKTKYQVYAHSQLVLLAESRSREGDESLEEGPNDEGEGSEAVGSGLPETLALNDDTLLEETAFTKTTSAASSSSSPLSHIDPARQPPLHPLDQALLICLCLNTHNSLPSSGLTTSQMMPFITRVVTHPRNWSVHTTALLLRSRLEADRSRTVERACLQLAALIDQMPTSDSPVRERLQYFHQLPLPSRWDMERELARRYMTVGVTRSALEIFTRLEMWEDAVLCLQRMEREDEAEKIVRDLLEGNKIESDLVSSLSRADLSDERKVKMSAARQGKLWCLLGDIVLASAASNRDPQRVKEEVVGHYDKAWEVSGHTSSRSRRSLGSILVSAGDFETAIPVLQSAAAINPLYARVWFTLGVCFVRQERWIEARDAFRRQVGVDEEDGEGWNNLAAVYLRLQEVKGKTGTSGERGAGSGDESDEDEAGDAKSTAFENKLAAFRALRTGLRFSPTNWRMWANYMLISIDVGELAESARAMTRLIEEPSAKVPFDIEVLDKLVDAVTRDDWNDGTPAVPPTTSNEGFGLLPLVERLFETTILPRISDDPRLYRCHARLLRWKEDWEYAMEDHLKAYRVGPVSQQAVGREEGSFKEAAREVEELVGVLEVLGPKAKAKGRKGDWKFTAKGIVRTFMGRTKDMFSETAEWERLKELLDELKRVE